MVRGIRMDRIDHIVLTVSDLDRTCEFYSRVLGMNVVTFANGRRALAFGEQKINLHQAGREFEPKATRPVAGSADFCLISHVSLEMLWSTSLTVTWKSCKVPSRKRGPWAR